MCPEHLDRIVLILDILVDFVLLIKEQVKGKEIRKLKKGGKLYFSEDLSVLVSLGKHSVIAILDAIHLILGS